MTTPSTPASSTCHEIADLLEAVLSGQPVPEPTDVEPSSGLPVLQPRPGPPDVVELSVARPQDEHDLIVLLDERYGASRELTHRSRRLHCWVSRGREIVLQSDPDRLVFAIYPSSRVTTSVRPG